MISVFDHPWLGALFGDQEVADLWSADKQVARFKAFEIALANALEANGEVVKGAGSEAAEAIASTSFNMAGLAGGTAKDGLPVPAMVRQLKAAAGNAASAVHTGATSQDVLDTALALTLKEQTGLILARLEKLEAAFEQLEAAHGSNRLAARTRMQVALEISAADRIDKWRSPLASHKAMLQAERNTVERLQFGGPVGDRSTLGDAAEAIARQMAESLGLEPAPAWHTDRTTVANYANHLSLISGTLGKFGKDIALMAQQGVDEVVLSGGGGSSAMPHKSNPVLAELLVTLAVFNATQLSGMHHALIHEQERSGTAWMLEWMILPQMCAATARGIAVALELCGQIDYLGRSARAITD